MDEHDTPDNHHATLSDYRMRWFGTLAVLALCLAFVAAVLIANPHHPQIDWPESQIAELRVLHTSGSRPVNAEYLEQLIKALPTCVVGEKYGAVCQDGEVTYDRGPGACADNGGVKEWITCK